MKQRKAVVCLTPSAYPVARKIADKFEIELHVRESRGLEGDFYFENALQHLQKIFREDTIIIGVCASGILIRSLAELLVDKNNEPAVIAVAEDGSSVIPLVGGHHGANEVTREIAEALDAFPAITTAGDLQFGIALDAPPVGFVLSNSRDMKSFMVELLTGAKINFTRDTPFEFNTFSQWLEDSNLPFSDSNSESAQTELQITLTQKKMQGSKKHLVFVPKNIAVGVGCERNTAPEELKKLVLETLDKNQISPQAVAVVSSIDLKSDEAAVLQMANHDSGEKTGLQCPIRFFSAYELEAQRPRLENPSEIVFQEVGCHGVSEGAALASVGPNGTLKVSKAKSERATCAIGESPEVLYPLNVGRARGTLYIVGTGPGSLEWRLPATERQLRDATDWVGYGLYLDLIEDLNSGKKLHRFDLGEEEIRVRHALKLAAEGKTVALVSSGDPGVYAMSTLVYELMERGEPEWKRIHVEASPGISALQAASARIGAPLGHDFCTISLSDLLTPWNTIERRIQAAAEGDFVIAFYNPVSRRRTTQLLNAQQILLKHRPADTPVVLARNLGRTEEHVHVVSLEKLDQAHVDMLTVVLVGSSQTRQLKMGSGEVKVYTPRGYDQKN